MSVSSGNPFKIRSKLGGNFVGGGPSPILNPRNISTHGYNGSPRYSADSMFSIYTGAARSGEAFDFEGVGIEEEEGEDMMFDDDMVVESSLDFLELDVEDDELVAVQDLVMEIRLTKSFLLEDLNLIDEDDDDDNDDEVDEQSTAGAGGAVWGYTGPLGGTQQDLDDMRTVGWGAEE